MKNTLIFLIIIFLFFSVFTLNAEHNWGGDFSAYIGQAKALVDKNVQGFVDAANFRVAHSNVQTAPNLYPWGYPLILVPVIAFFGINITILKFVTYLFFIGSLVVSYYLFKDKLTDKFALLLVLAVATSPFFFDFKQNILSDVPAMFFLLLSVFLIQKIYFENSELKIKKIQLFFLGLSIFSSFFIRANAVVIIPFLLLVQAIERKKWLRSFSDVVVHAMPYFIFLLLYAATWLVFPEGSYTKNHTLFNPGLILDTVMCNAHYYIIVFANFFGSPAYKIVWTAYFFSGIFFLVGIFYNFRKHYTYVLFSMLTLSLFLVFPYQQGLRFIIPVIPFYIFFAILGLKGTDFKKAVGINSEKTAYVLSFALIFLFLNQIWIMTKAPLPEGPFSKSSKELFEFVRKKTSAAETFSFFKPRVLYLFAGRKSVYINSVEFLKKSEVDYYVYAKGVSGQDMEAYLDQSGKLVFGNDQFRVYDLR